MPRVGVDRAGRADSQSPESMRVASVRCNTFEDNISNKKETLIVKVRLVDGKCTVKDRDIAHLDKCNKALAEMSDFQRKFLFTGSEGGKPIKLIFTESIVRHKDGSIEKKSEFKSYDSKKSLKEKLNCMGGSAKPQKKSGSFEAKM
ncbi:hypothetical protein PoB_000602400 [Plakobranchus ocellatus]|uniref:Uncharacterized protein n=1 Tax=Plakobranchus ocellatus TaxID=259542 RepID=A0AAV3YB62_9GAST|nr:hypothetical protein PoB_000602400 [Plakobranchus ocellatus]